MKNWQRPTYRRDLQQRIRLTVTGSSYLLQWHGRNDLFQGRLGWSLSSVADWKRVKDIDGQNKTVSTILVSLFARQQGFTLI